METTANPPRPNPRKLKGKRAELAAWIAREQPVMIGEPEWAAICQALAPVSESYLRKILRETDVKLAPAVEGVRQEGFEALEKSLLALLDEYQSGDAALRKRARQRVIEAKDHARFALKRASTADVGQVGNLRRVGNPPRTARLTIARRLATCPTSEDIIAVKEEMVRWMLTWLENPPLFREWLALRKRAMARETSKEQT